VYNCVMDDTQQRQIYTPNTIPVQPPGVPYVNNGSYMNVVKVPLAPERPLRWPIYFFSASALLAVLAVIPFLFPGVGSYVRSLFVEEPPVEQYNVQQPEIALTQRGARTIALKAVIEAEGMERARARAQTFSIVDARTIVTEYGWIFFWNTKKFIETRDIKTSIPGAGPIVVTKKGEVEFLRTNVPPVEAIAEYEIRTGVRQAVISDTATSTATTTAPSAATTTGAIMPSATVSTTTATTTIRATSSVPRVTPR
jgi:hypothetical protein